MCESRNETRVPNNKKKWENGPYVVADDAIGLKDIGAGLFVDDGAQSQAGSAPFGGTRGLKDIVSLQKKNKNKKRKVTSRP